MANSLFNALGGKTPQQHPFVQFMNQMRWQNPTDIINQMVSSGKISQEQLNQVQQQAKSMMSQFDVFKNMFGF